MTSSAIRVRDLTKDYRIYSKPSDMLVELFSRRPRHVSHRALNGVTFDVARGEVVGIIGRNGAGKSTLLKVLTGVLAPDSGTVEVNGRTAAILELGTGLNPEYSGRDNIFFGQVCRGLSPREARERMDEVIAFAELEQVIDRPFKTYSSGMQARLLFATSIHVESDILIIDEALAAGDILFQEKCFRKMREIARSGRSVLFVSHGLDLVQQLCNRAILMHAGEILLEGDTGEVTKAYYDLAAHIRNDTARGLSGEKSAQEARGIVEANRQRQRIAKAAQDAPAGKGAESAAGPGAAADSLAPPAAPPVILAGSETGRQDQVRGSVAEPRDHGHAADDAPPAREPDGEPKIDLLSIRVLNDRLEDADAIEFGKDFYITARFSSDTDIPHLIAGMEIRLPTGFLVFTIQNTLEGIDFGCRANEPFDMRWRLRNSLQNGSYFVGVGIGQVLYSSEQGLRHSPFTILAQELNARIFNVVAAREFGGMVDLALQFEVHAGTTGP